MKRFESNGDSLEECVKWMVKSWVTRYYDEKKSK